MTKIPQEFKPNGYNPSTGVYASSYIFTGDWEDELRALDYTPRTRQFDEVSSTDEEKGQKISPLIFNGQTRTITAQRLQQY